MIARRATVLFAALIAAVSCNRLSEREQRVVRAIDQELEAKGLLAPDAVRAFYDKRAEPAWLDDDDRKAAVRALLSSDEDGLDPSAYHLDEIEKLLAAEQSAKTAAAIDVHLTDGLLVLLRHLRAGKIDPATNRARWTADDPEVEALLENHPAAALASVRPNDSDYTRLRDALASAKDERREALLASLERRRSAPRKLAPTRVEVDVPAFTMTYFEERAPKLTSRVIVGTSSSGTPVLHDAIEHVVLNPTWAVPRTILVEELVPKIRVDPDFLARGGYRVFEKGKEVFPPPVEWYAEDPPFSVVQEPGPANPLGRVKFVFPNNAAVYLHDTPFGHLFDAKQRAFSHGCIRLEKPMELASMLTGLSIDELEKKLADGKTRAIPLDPKIDVHLLYYTAVVEDGRVRFREDLYGRDRALVRALRARP